MSEFMRDAIPIIVMYGFVTLLAPFIGYAMWLALQGDRDHTAENEALARAELESTVTEHSTEPEAAPRAPRPARQAVTADTAA